jgi:hypothetical protein
MIEKVSVVRLIRVIWMDQGWDAEVSASALFVFEVHLRTGWQVSHRAYLRDCPDNLTRKAGTVTVTALLTMIAALLTMLMANCAFVFH